MFNGGRIRACRSAERLQFRILPELYYFELAILLLALAYICKVVAFWYLKFDGSIVTFKYLDF